MYNIQNIDQERKGSENGESLNGSGAQDQYDCNNDKLEAVGEEGSI